ncbi:MAG: hypothetical protein WB611_04120 [Stellaceae bacterium]
MKRSERYPGDSVKLGRLDRGESVDFGLFVAPARAPFIASMLVRLIGVDGNANSFN